MLPLDPAELPADAVEVGRIADAWGIKGWMRIQAYSASPEALFSCKRWYLMAPDAGAHPYGAPAGRAFQAFTGTVLLAISEAKQHSDGVVASARDITDRNAAELLRGARVFIPRSSFPSAAPDEYYWVDLIGLEVSNREGLVLGVVKELLSTGPQTVLVIVDERDGKPHERMIPFVAAFVDAVELEQRRIRVDWQPDY
jgi:16S rRNA processing protein RimM